MTNPNTVLTKSFQIHLFSSLFVITFIDHVLCDKHHIGCCCLWTVSSINRPAYIYTSLITSISLWSH